MRAERREQMTMIETPHAAAVTRRLLSKNGRQMTTTIGGRGRRATAERAVTARPTGISSKSSRSMLPSLATSIIHVHHVNTILRRRQLPSPTASQQSLVCYACNLNRILCIFLKCPLVDGIYTYM